MVTDGDTVTISGFVVAVTGDPPLITYTNGPVPVKAMLKVVLVPSQVVGVPLMTAVGRGLTVTTALPVMSAAVAAQLASVSDVTL